MSTTNTETLVLYKNAKLYNGSRYKVFQGSSNFDYDNWLDINSNGKMTKTVYYKSITEPILLLEDLPIMDAYTYGYITAMGKKYYIFIDRITTDQNGRTSITYSVDWWATEWANVQITKAHINRISTKPNYMAQPYVPFHPTISSTALTNDFLIVGTYIPSIEGIDSALTYIIIEGNKNTTALIDQGQWYELVGAADSDIKDAFIVPYFSLNDLYEFSAVFWDLPDLTQSSTSAHINNAINERFPANDRPDIGDSVYCPTTHVRFVKQAANTWQYVDNKPDIRYFTASVHKVGNPVNSRYTIMPISIDPTEIPSAQINYHNFSKTDSTLSFSSDEVSRQAVVDWNGNLIWECPIGYNNTGYKINLTFGVSHVMLEFLPLSNPDNSEMVNGKAFTYDCRHPALFTDSYGDYVLKNRDYDIAMRKIQSDKQLYTAVASTAENAGFGMAFGQEKGMAAATIGGIIETVGTFAINSFFDPKIQEQYDKRYKLMTDQITLVGDSITDVYNAIDNLSGLLKKVTITMDTASQTIMNNDISVNGYYADETVPNLATKFASGVIIQADNTIVEGAVPLDCKYQIVYRLQNGVEFI